MGTAELAGLFRHQVPRGEQGHFHPPTSCISPAPLPLGSSQNRIAPHMWHEWVVQGLCSASVCAHCTARAPQVLLLPACVLPHAHRERAGGGHSTEHRHTLPHTHCQCVLCVCYLGIAPHPAC